MAAKAGSRPQAGQSAPVASVRECRVDPEKASFFKDQALTMKLGTRIQFHKGMLSERVEVKVTGGVAILSGNVSTPDHIALAGRIAAETEGINCVSNYLKVGPPLPQVPPP